jgi:hypothetical protein
LLLLLQNGYGQTSRREIESSDASAVVQAIQDEIYDYGYQKEFWGFETAGPRGPEAQFNVYIKQELTPTKGGLEGVVIYKYPPFGEVIRPFIVAPDGTAYLVGKPSNGFSWTQPNTKTIYMDDDDIARDKRDWRKVKFELDLSPSNARIKTAVERQKKRVGFSQWESSRAARK